MREAAIEVEMDSASLEHEICCWGDSRMEQGFSDTLSAVLGVPCHNFGLSGNTSSGVLRRLHAEKTFYRAVERHKSNVGNRLRLEPSSPGPVERGYGRANPQQYIVAQLGEIKGAFSFDGADAWFSTKSSADDSLNFERPHELTPIFETRGKNKYLIDDPFKMTALLSFGVNNLYEPQRVIADYKKSVSYLENKGSKIIILGTLGGINSNNNQQSESLLEITDALKSNHPAYFAQLNEYSAREYLMSRYDPSSPADVEAVDNGLIPPSLRIDSLHLNDRGRVALAEFVRQYLLTRG